MIASRRRCSSSSSSGRPPRPPRARPPRHNRDSRRQRQQVAKLTLSTASVSFPDADPDADAADPNGGWAGLHHGEGPRERRGRRWCSRCKRRTTCGRGSTSFRPRTSPGPPPARASSAGTLSQLGARDRRDVDQDPAFAAARSSCSSRNLWTPSDRHLHGVAPLHLDVAMTPPARAVVTAALTRLPSATDRQAQGRGGGANHAARPVGVAALDLVRVGGSRHDAR